MDEYEKRHKEMTVILEERLEPHRKAIRIVERLTEKSVNEDFLVSCAKFLMPSHYADAVEERSVDTLCGYPLCDNLMEKITKQKYHISMKTNKVYDMSERKLFCKLSCYKASKYYQAQIPTSPLWSRPREQSVEIKLLKQGDTLPSTEEPLDTIILRVKVTEDEIENPSKEDETTGEVDNLIGELSYLNLHDSRSQRKRYQEFERKEMEQEKIHQTEDISQNFSRTDGYVDVDQNKPIFKTDGPSAERNDTSFRGNGHVHSDTENISEREDRGALEMSKRKGKKKECHRQEINPGKTAPVVLQHVSKCLMEWRTMESVKYLNNCSGSVESEGSSSGNKEEQNGRQEEKQDILMDDALSINEVKEDERNQQGVVTYAASKPVPEIDQLRGETQLFTLKVKQFYSLRPDKLQPSGQAKEKKTTKGSDKEKPNEPNRIFSLPPIDSKSQMLIRRKILLDKLHKVLGGLLPTLGMSIQEISANLRDLIMTFNLSSHNISFKPSGWTLVSLCILHILALKVVDMQSKLTTRRSLGFLEVIWKQYSISGEEVEYLVKQFVNG